MPEIDAIMADIEAAEGDMCNCYLDLKPELPRLQVPHQSSTLCDGLMSMMMMSIRTALD